MTLQANAQEPNALTETYDGWIVQCQTVGEGDASQKACQMSQELRQNESGQRIILLGIVLSASGTSKATVVAPFGLLLSEGMLIEMDGVEIARGEFRTCLPAGCIVNLDLSEALIAKLKAGAAINVVFTAENEKLLRIEMSLKGFTAAYNRLRELHT